MSNPNSRTPIPMPDTFQEAIPILNDNFYKITSTIGDLAPRQFGTGNSGCRPIAGGQMVLVSLFFDRAEYDSFATLTPQYDVFIDSGTNATGTITIDNTAGVSTYVVNIGQYFCPASEIIDPPAKPHIFIATSSASVPPGSTGSVSVIAERCGIDYNLNSVIMADNAGFFFPNYFAGAEVGTQPVKIRVVNITPDFGGSGGGAPVLTLVSSGGSGVENDSTKLFPNGSGLTAGQKNMTVQHHLNLTTTIPNYSLVAEYPYTKNFATATVRVINHDIVPHSVYIYLTGTIFSGVNGDLFN